MLWGGKEEGVSKGLEVGRGGQSAPQTRKRLLPFESKWKLFTMENCLSFPLQSKVICPSRPHRTKAGGTEDKGILKGQQG